MLLTAPLAESDFFLPNEILRQIRRRSRNVIIIFGITNENTFSSRRKADSSPYELFTNVIKHKTSEFNRRVDLTEVEFHDKSNGIFDFTA